MQREGNRKQDGRDQAGFAKAEERHIVPRAGQGARDMPPREEGPGQGSAHCSPGLKARTPVCNLGGIPCKSSVARGSKAFPAAQTPPLQNSHPDSPFLFSEEPLSQAQPLQPEVRFRSLCRARPPGTPTHHTVAISGGRDPFVFTAHSPEMEVPFPPSGLPKLEKHWVLSRPSSLSCWGGRGGTTNHSISENRPKRLIQL